ncbi:MAG: metallophosphoesterase [Thermoproteota archaeon]
MYGRFIFAAILAILALVFFSFVIEPNFITTTTYIKVYIEKLPKDFNGFRIVHITDLHFGSLGLPIKYSRVLEKVRTLRPDLIAVTGDLVSNKESAKEALNFVVELSKISDVYLVFGNWDHWSALNISDFEDATNRSRIRVLLNKNVAVRRNGSLIYVAGVDDPYSGYDDLESALRNIKEGSVVVLLAHSPQIIDKCIGKVDLVLSGHTHGGQVVIPFLGPLFVPLPSKYRKFTYGYFDLNETKMFVSRGVGTSILPVRFLCPPEVAVIELVGS